MKTLKQNWKEVFIDSVESATRSIQILAPYIKVYGTGILAEKAKCPIECVTDFRPDACYMGSSDLAGYEQLLGLGSNLSSLPYLHAKVYIFDRARAIVTSGNLTYGGLVHNAEYGLLVDEPATVSAIVADFEELSSRAAFSVTQVLIAETRSGLAGLPPRPRLPRLPLTPNPTPTMSTVAQAVALPSRLAKLTRQQIWAFNAIDRLSAEFTLAQVYEYADALKLEFPENNTPRDSLRSLLQDLRDRGFIQFVRRGVYRKIYV